MVEFKLAIGDSKTKRTFKAELKSPEADQLFGKKVGDSFRGELIGLTGFEFEITGGSDNAGFPMKRDIEGVGRRKLLLTDGFGFYAKRHGQRKRRSIRGNTISNETAQINCKITKWGEADLLKHFGIVKDKATEEKEQVANVPSEQEPKPEEKKEVPVEQPKEEPKPEETEQTKPAQPSDKVAPEPVETTPEPAPSKPVEAKVAKTE